MRIRTPVIAAAVLAVTLAAAVFGSSASAVAADRVLFDPWLTYDPANGPAVSLLDLQQVNPYDGSVVGLGGEVRVRKIDLSAEVSGEISEVYGVEFEVRREDEVFVGAATNTVTNVVSGSRATLQLRDVSGGGYQWQARVIADDGQPASDWVQYSAAEVMDFASVTLKVEVVPTDFLTETRKTFEQLEAPCVFVPAGREYVFDEGESSSEYGNDLYLYDVFSCINDYYEENSYGRISFDYHVSGDTANSPWAAVVNEDGGELSQEYFTAGNNVEGSFNAFANHASQFVDDGTYFDIVLFLHDGDSQQSEASDESQKLSTGARGSFLGTEMRPIGITVLAEQDGFGTWVHELGHLTGVFTTADAQTVPDLYAAKGRRTDIGEWGLLGEGEGVTYGGHEHPPHMSSYTKWRLGLLVEEPVDVTAPAVVDRYLTPLSRQAYLGPLFRYWLGDPLQAETPSYIIEARDRSVDATRWDRGLPGISDRHAVVYYVVDIEDPTVPDIVEVNRASLSQPFNDGVLNPGTGENFEDYDSRIKITAYNPPSPSADKVGVHVEPFVPADEEIGAVLRKGIEGSGSLLRRLLGLLPGVDLVQLNLSDDTVVHVPMKDKHETLVGHVAGITVTAAALYLLYRISLLIADRLKVNGKRRRLIVVIGRSVIALTVIVLGSVTLWELNFGGGLLYTSDISDKNRLWPYPVYFDLSKIEAGEQPDLDLHVYCDDGRHVGVNYSTGEYEVQIDGAKTNGDTIASPEWIFFPPEGNEGCRHVVSSHDNEAFLDENPEIAAQLTDVSDAYDVYARYIDPASGIFTSQTLSDQVIEPGETVVHVVSGTTDVSISPGIRGTFTVDESRP